MANALHTPGVVDSKAARLDDGGLLALQGPGVLDVRTGVLAGPGTTALVTGTSATSPMTVQIAAHHWITTRSAAWGPYRGTAEAVKTVNIAAAPGSGSRIDVVYVKQQDNTFGIPSPDATAAELYGVATGTATTGTPTKPSLPVGALELATVQVSAGATSTNGSGVTITNTVRQTAARGGILPVRSGDTDAGVYVGQYRDHPANGLERWDGSKWTTTAPLGQWTKLPGGTGYNWPITGDSQWRTPALPGLGAGVTAYQITVPDGRQLDSEIYYPWVSAAAGTTVRMQLMDWSHNAVLDGVVLSVAGAAVSAPVRLAGSVAGTGGSQSIGLQVWADGSGCSLSGDPTSGGQPYFRYRIL